MCINFAPMKNSIQCLTVRIYGLLLNEKGELLVCSELIQGQAVNKFPGGGLELGEGPCDALLREMREEADLECQIMGHVYTTDFFIQSVFMPDTQVLCLYYRLSCPDLSPLERLSHNPNLVLEFVKVSHLKDDFFSFESDRRAFRAFVQGYNYE